MQRFRTRLRSGAGGGGVSLVGGAGFGGGLAFARASSATYLDAGGALRTVSNDVPRYSADARLLIESAATNLLAAPAAPATQTVTIADTGTHTLWVAGTGSATITAGTGAATGLGAATAGVPVVFSVTTTGTFDVTVAGSLTRFQLERYGTPTSFIAGSRVADSTNLRIGGQVLESRGTVFVHGQFPAAPDAALYPYLVSLNDGTTNEVNILYDGPFARFRSFVRNGAVLADSFGTIATAQVTGQAFRAAMAYDRNAGTLLCRVHNGTTQSALYAASGVAFPSLTNLRVGRTATLTAAAPREFIAVTYWPYAMSPLQLTALVS